MAKGKGGGDNKYMRRIKNYEMIGAGKKETQEQILQRGPNTPQKTVDNIKAKQAEKTKDQ